MNPDLKKLLEFSILNIDKPTGPTSFQISEYIKRSLKLKKTSHLGTLDPQVSGVLPVFLGRACKLSSFFLLKSKTYVGIMRLHEIVSENVLKKEMSKFIGKITQMPPVRSAVKRQLRERTVYSFELLEMSGKDVLFKAEVESGTYIRTLIVDLGKNIGGAHMLELRRTSTALFSESDKNFINLYKFDELIEKSNSDKKELIDYLIPADQAIKKVLPVVQLNEKNKKKLLTGKPLTLEDISDIFLFNSMPLNSFFVGCISDEFIEVCRKVSEGDIIARPEFVYN